MAMQKVELLVPRGEWPPFMSGGGVLFEICLKFVIFMAMFSGVLFLFFFFPSCSLVTIYQQGSQVSKKAEEESRKDVGANKTRSAS